MGQRFQIITNTNGKLKVYHSQWLWGDYVIRRIGTAIKYYLIYAKKNYRSFEDYLKLSFYGKPNDMNSFYRYYSNEQDFNDNKEICINWKKDKQNFIKSKDFKSFLKTLDNNDGFFYIEFDEKDNIKGYCFMLCYYDNKELKPITAEEYLKHYDRQEGFNKKQKKEFEEGKKTFNKLKLIGIPKKIYNLK